MSGQSLSAQTARETLYEIVRRDTEFETKATDMLSLANRYLGTETGFLTRIDADTGDWETVVSTDAETGVVPAGLTHDLAETYCSHIADSDPQLQIPDTAEWAGDSASGPHGISCYLGTALRPEGETTGTVCFVATESRSDGFSDDETLFAELVARLLERELAHKQAQEELHAQRSEAEKREQAMQQAYEIIADSERSFDQQLTALLELVRETVDTEYATLSHVDGDTYEFEAVVTPPGDDLTAGDTVPLQTTNCERVVETTETLVLNDVDRDAPELADRAGNSEWGITCYLGAPVVVNGDVYGTFCFYGLDARAEAFTSWEVAFVELLSGWVSRALERRERARALDEAKTQLEAATEAAGVGTWEWHVQEDTLVMGPSFARMFGVDPESAREGVSIDSFVTGIHDDDRERVEERIQGALDDCGEYEAEYRLRNEDGDPRWVVARGRVECDADGTPLRFPGAITDITERKQVQHELEQQNERLEEFASVISHDLRNPLNVIELHLDMVRDDHQSEHLDIIENAHTRMETLLEELLTLARQGESIDNLELVDVGAVVEECWDTVETTSATLVVDCEHCVTANRSRLKQLFENLFRNAIEHGVSDDSAAEDEPAVTIRVGDLDDGFYVEDDGPGIDPDDRERVFEGGYTTTDEGTGFGLRIVKQVADAHGWEIRVTDGTDGGARFEITGVETPLR